MGFDDTRRDPADRPQDRQASREEPAHAAFGEVLENGLRGSASSAAARPDYAGTATPDRSTPPPISSSSWQVDPGADGGSDAR